MHPIPTPRADSEFAKMLAGELYLSYDPELVDLRRRARRLTRMFNQTTEEQSPERSALLTELFGTLGPSADIEPDFRCDYGFNIRAGARLYMNFGCVVLDCALVTIGDGCLFGPGVHLYTATHPLDTATRASGRELARPITLGHNVWIGGGAIIGPDVTIGDGAVIGAGSVVVKSVAAGEVVVGNPARRIKTTG